MHSLRARAVLVDMEEGPVSETMRGPLGELFDQRQASGPKPIITGCVVWRPDRDRLLVWYLLQFITDVSGAGNNFAHGFGVYGPQVCLSCHHVLFIRSSISSLPVLYNAHLLWVM